MSKIKLAGLQHHYDTWNRDPPMKNPPKEIWGNGVNLNGLWWKTPRKFYWDKEFNSWWDEVGLSGDFNILILGLNSPSKYNEFGIITFASKSKKEVEIWTLGVRTALVGMKNFCYNS